MANTTLADLLLLIQENPNGDISAADIQTITTELWNNAIISTAIDGNFAIFETDIQANQGAIVDSGLSPLTLPLSTASIAALDTKVSLPVVAGAAGQILLYNGASFDWNTPDNTLVGLDRVDNTSDLDKPISTATQAALDAKEDSLPVDAAGFLENDGLGNLSWNPVAGSGATQLDELSDVAITAPAADHALMYDGIGEFVNRPLVKADVSDFSDADYATAAQGLLADSATQISASDSDVANVRTLAIGEVTDTDVNLSTVGASAGFIVNADLKVIDDTRLNIPQVNGTVTFGVATDAENVGAMMVDLTDNVLTFSDGTEWVKLGKQPSTADVDDSAANAVMSTFVTVLDDNPVIFDTILDGSAYSNVNGLYTAPADGRYAFNITLHSTSGNTGNTVALRKNGSTIIPNTTIQFDDVYATRHFILPLLQGETISVYNNSGNSVVVNTYSDISVYRIS